MTLQDGDYFDDEAADRAVRFIETLCSFTQGKRGPFILEDFQRDDIIRPLFGWKRADGARKFRTCYIELPRKNGKSNLAAAIALLLLLGDQEAGAQIVSAAGSRDQARIVFSIARDMVQANPHLSGACKLLRNEIHHSGSFYRSISAEAGTAHGLNLHGLIFDELHVMKTAELWETLTTSVGARRQPLVVAITTAGQDPSSICRQVHDYAAQVRDGIVADPTFLPIIYAAIAGTHRRRVILSHSKSAFVLLLLQRAGHWRGALAGRVVKLARIIQVDPPTLHFRNCLLFLLLLSLLLLFLLSLER